MRGQRLCKALRQDIEPGREPAGCLDPKRRTRMDPPIAQRDIRPRVEPAIEYLLWLAADLAKSQASEMMGEREQAFGYLERHG
jgi:hypothetical protein